jgi:HEAT repeat protein
LHGLSPGGPERFLGAYFGKEELWIPKLLRELPRLPDGLRWVRTPVLLLLAAALHRRDQQLPDATLDLYGDAVKGLLRWRAQRLFGGKTEQKVERALQFLAHFAHQCLLPREGQPRVAFSRGEVEAKREPLLLGSGLFTGADTIRFAHLSLGEYLAAHVAVKNLEEETERWLNAPVANAAAIHAREALPMAWAMAEEGKLTELLERAATRDRADHLVLRLLMRAIAYGGAGSAALARDHGRAIVELLATRLAAPSGRFGDVERRMCRDAERALWAVRAHLPQDCSRQLLSSAQPSSEMADEVLVLTIAAGAQPVRPPVTIHGSALSRSIGEAWARAGMSLERIIALTAGEPWSGVRTAAIGALASDPESKALLRERLTDDDEGVHAAVVLALASDRESIPLLREGLAHRYGEVRIAAAQALASDPESRPLLSECLANGASDVRVAAARALASDPESRLLLHEYLAHGDEDLRAAAVLALGPDPESRPLLRKRLADRYGRVRVAAVRALASDPESRPPIRERLADSHRRVRVAAVQALASDPESRLLLRERLRDDHESVRAAAVRALASDPESRPPIRERLADSHRRVRVAAVQALASDPESRLLLREQLADSDLRVRAAVVQAFASDLNFRPLLRQRLARGDEHTRAAAARVLASDPESRPLLRKCLADGSFRLRAAAVRALSSEPESRPLLRQRLADRHHDVRTAAVQALASDPESRHLLRRCLAEEDARVLAAAFQAIASNPESRPLLREQLGDSDSRVRFAAVGALASDPDSKPLLCQRLADRDGHVRMAVVQALASDPEFRPLLRERLTDGDLRVRLAAVEALSSNPESRPSLRECLTDREPIVRAYIVEALASDPESRPLLRTLLADSEPLVCAAAVEALASDPESTPLLRERLADNDFRARAAAVAALAHDPESMPLLHEQLADGDDNTRSAAVEALASDPQSRPLLRECLAHGKEYVRIAAIEALAHDPESRGLLRECLSDGNEYVRSAAVEALASDPESRPLLRECLADCSEEVRIDAAGVLASSRSRHEGFEAAQEGALRAALRAVAADPNPSASTPEPSLKIEAKLVSYLRAPRRLHLDAEPDLGTALIAWLLARLGWGSPTGEFGNGRLWGELAEPISTPIPPLLLLRVAMLDSRLPTERRLHPHHNLIEAHKIARHLRTTRPLTLFLACADVPFEDLIPPSLKPGQVRWGPTFYGFRLSEEPISIPDEAAERFADLLVSRDPLSLWRTWDDSRRAAAIDRLGVLADRDDVEPLTLAPLVTRLGAELPEPLRRSLAKRITPSISGAVPLVDEYALAQGTAGLRPTFPFSTPGPSPLAALLDSLRLGTDGEDPKPALSALDGIADLLRPGRAQEVDALEVVHRLDRIRNRHRTPAVAKALLACVETLVNLRPADGGFGQKVEFLRLSLRRSLSAKEGQ